MTPASTAPANPGDRRRAAKLLAALRRAYPDARCELTHTSPHELLIATILSAQCTDVAVNKATPALFSRFPRAEDFAAASPSEIEPYIRSLGFFRMKARAINESMAAIVDRFGGRVPATIEELVTLRGVARKTANVVLSNAFGINAGVVVDTHVLRLSRRMGLVREGASPEAVERRLMALFPRESWGVLSHLLIFHGRRACKARGGGCADDPICRAFGIACERRTPLAVTAPSRRGRAAGTPRSADRPRRSARS